MNTDVERFAFATHAILERVKDGISPLDAAIQVGLTPREFYKMMGDKEFAQLVGEHEDAFFSSIESRLYENALNGNMTAILTVLYNRMNHRWSDRKKVDVTTGVTVNVAVMETSKEALRAMLAEDAVGVARALGPGGALDDDIIDGEVVDDATG